MMRGLSAGKVKDAFDRFVIEHGRFNISNPSAIGFVIGKGSCNFEELKGMNGVFSIRLIQNRVFDSRNGEPAAWISIIAIREARDRCIERLSECVSDFDRRELLRNSAYGRKMSIGNNSTVISETDCDHITC